MYIYQYKELPQFHNFIYFPRLTPISETLLSLANMMIAVARAPEFFALVSFPLFVILFPFLFVSTLSISLLIGHETCQCCCYCC